MVGRRWLQLWRRWISFFFHLYFYPSTNIPSSFAPGDGYDNFTSASLRQLVPLVPALMTFLSPLSPVFFSAVSKVNHIRPTEGGSLHLLLGDSYC